MSKRGPKLPLVGAILAGVLLPIPAAAQIGFDLTSSRVLGENYFPHPVPPFQRTAALEMTGDFRNDALVRVGDHLVLAVGPGVYESLVTLDCDMVDYCPVKGVGPLGRDAILISSDRPRLELWSLDPTTLEFQVQAVGAAVAAGAVSLWQTDLDGDSFTDVVGIGADRRSILLLHGPMTATSTTVLALNPMVPGETIHRMVPIEWDGAPGPEFALATTFGVRVLTLGGQNLYQVSSDGDDSDRLVAVKRGAQTDRLAWFLQIPGGSYHLFALDALQTDELFFCGYVDPVALSAGDYDGDGLEDLCLSQRTTGQLAYWHHQSATSPSFGWNDYAAWDPTTNGSGGQPAPTNQAESLLVDLDQDGDGDVLFPVQKEGAVKMMRNGTLAHLDRAPTVSDASYDYDLTQHMGLLHLTLQAPAVPPVEADRLELVVWRQSTFDDETRVEPTAIHVDSIPVLAWPMQVDVPLFEDLYTDTLFHMELRLAEYVGNVKVSAACTAIWTFTTSEDSKDDMIALGGAVPEEILDTPIDIGGGTFLPTPGGWTGPLPCIPCFPDDELPDAGG